MSDSHVLWGLAALISAAVVLPYGLLFHRRRRRDHARLAEARGLGIDQPSGQFPYIDPQRCIGCATCVKACPEGDVLGIVGGTAVVINGLRCVGHALCEEACPVGAIEVGLGDLKSRADVPLLDEWQESTVPGGFIAGELSGLALIRFAIEQGERVVERIAARLAQLPRASADRGDLFDVVVVGAGPAGLSAALTATRHGLSCLLIDKEAGLGGTVLHFPRRKLVLTRPVEFPLGGALERSEYSKEEVLEKLERLLRDQRVAVRFGEALSDLERQGDEIRLVVTSGVLRARQVVLAIGRRGSPRRLGVPGEELPKVMYQLRDADTYRGLDLLVVGGGDSAVEAAVGLARLPNNRVTLSYRKSAFVRIKKKNQDAIEKAVARGRVRLALGSEVASIAAGTVTLRFGAATETIANEAVFVLIGGDPPFELLKRMGIRFGGDGAGLGGTRQTASPRPAVRAPRPAPSLPRH